MTTLKLTILTIGLAFFFLGCNNSTANAGNNDEGSSSSIETNTNTDPLTTAKAALENFNNKKGSLKTTHTDFICDRGGGFIKYYYDNDQLAAIEISEGSDNGDVVLSFIIHANSLCAVHSKDLGLSDDNAFYSEEIYYINQDKLLEGQQKNFETSESELSEMIKNTAFKKMDASQSIKDLLAKFEIIKSPLSEEDVYANFCD